MEKHKCKLCFGSFSNGRALGGHVRSHIMNFVPLPSEPEAESASSPLLSPSREAEEEDLCYGLRENPNPSFRIADPQFSSFAGDAGSVILQDTESETESPMIPTRRRRSNRYLNQKKIQSCSGFHEEEGTAKPKLRKLSHAESWNEAEPVSSISNVTTEEDMAFCLMMLSRDRWNQRPATSEEDEEKTMEENDSEELKFPKNGRKFRCETCKRSFRSYQALGGHRASHKKMKLSSTSMAGQDNAASSASMAEKRIHECPVCFRVFSSGQALGGHKRSHISAKTSTTNRNLSLIDLNLPAPIEEENDTSQIELSAISDSEFIKPIWI